MKDVTNYEMPRGAVSMLRSGDIRMGEPSRSNVRLSYSEYIAILKTTLGTEISKYQEEEKEKSITLVATSETVTAQTRFRIWGCRTLYMKLQNYCIVEYSGKNSWKG